MEHRGEARQIGIYGPWQATPNQYGGKGAENSPYLCVSKIFCVDHNFNGLVQERRNSSALAMELCLRCTNPSIYPGE